MKINNRNIDLICDHSQFLWGPRRVGKSYLLRHLFKDAVYIDLLKSDVFLEYTGDPAILRHRYSDSKCSLIIIDEIQKCPQLLDEVHWMIENLSKKFILTGSSARKLRRSHANLLAGRALRKNLQPLCSDEISDFELEQIFISGLLPPHFLAKQPVDLIRSYVSDYLKEEIAAEAAARNLQAFTNFLKVAAISNGEIINFTNIAREVGVSAKVVKSYFEILEDTLLGYRLQPWRKTLNRKMIETDKFYFFDIGVANYLSRRKPASGTPEFGRSFEHFILMELLAYRSYRMSELEITYWRTALGQEVDFILEDKKVAIEVKSSKRINAQDLKGLTILSEEGGVERRIIISQELEKKILKDRYGEIEILPWRGFLKELWSGEIIN